MNIINLHPNSLFVPVLSMKLSKMHHLVLFVKSFMISFLNVKVPPISLLHFTKSFFFSEREKGKTVEVGRGFFETEKKHFTILDAPGHKSFVPNMIGGASQADLAVLVISARKGEFETGFERGGQTREHAMLVKTAGVKHMVVLINKMDDPTVQWDKARYDYCKDNLTPYLKKVGFNPAKDVKFMPCSGLTGAGLMEPVGDVATWYS